MLEESSRAGCLQSSYLLWEHSRKAAVSLILSFSAPPGNMTKGLSEHKVTNMSNFDINGLFVHLNFRWQIQEGTFSVCELSGTMLAKDAGRRRCVIYSLTYPNNCVPILCLVTAFFVDLEL